MSARGSGRTTHTLRGAIDHMFRTRCDVMILINDIREFNYMLQLLVDVIGITPGSVDRSRRVLRISGYHMVFVPSNRPDCARGFDIDNIFVDHHFYETRHWRDWHWLFAFQDLPHPQEEPKQEGWLQRIWRKIKLFFGKGTT